MQRAPRALLAQAAQSWAALAQQQQGSAPHRCFAHDSAMAAAVRNANCKDVPAGHASSDLSSTACHIGLNRLRDLTMRQDLCLWRGDAKTPIKELLKGQRIIVVGFPGGKVCTEQHIPSFIKLTSELSQRGVDKVLCITPSTPEAIQELRAQEDLKSPLVELLADKNGGFVRMLGFELGVGEGTGPKCQRFAGIVDNGILLKVRIESKPIELKTTDCKSMLELWDDVYMK